jgi:hypothetical protein
MKTEFLSETLDRRKVKKNNKITSTTSLILESKVAISKNNCMFLKQKKSKIIINAYEL